MKTNILGLAMTLMLVCLNCCKAMQEDAQKDRDQQNASTTNSEDNPILAITGGDVYTVTGEVIRRGTVLIQD